MEMKMSLQSSINNQLSFDLIFPSF
jgi:hypothetical protein